MKHTPGPWISHSDNNIYPLWDEDGVHPIADTVNLDNERNSDEQLANACLISASPELLKELYNMIDLFTPFAETKEHKEAIKKANKVIKAAVENPYQN